ncbi:MAG: acyltransferase [Bacteroidota bacterium]
MIKKSSLLSIDILRAIAALGVFSYHQHVASYLARYTHIAIIDQLDNFGAQYAVPLFFLISGYCIHLSNLKYINKGKSLPLKAYYKRRFLRIYPPYLFALIFAIATNYFTYGKSSTYEDIIVHIFSLQGFTVKYFNTINVVLWTISIEIAFYLIYPIFYYIRSKYSLNKALLFSLLITTISIIYFSFQDEVSLPQHFFVFNLWFAWCSGAYLADKFTLNPADLKKPAFILIYSGILIAFLAIRFIPNNWSIVYNQLNILIWTAPLVLLLSNENWLQKHNNLFLKAISKLGLSSYSLYLLHEPLILLKNCFAHKFLPAQLQLIWMCAGLIAIPFIAWYSFVYIEKPFAIRKKIAQQLPPPCLKSL